MTTPKNERLFDVRTIDRNLKKGLISEAEYQAYLASLPDAATKGTRVVAEYVEGVLAGRDEDED